MRNLVVLLVVAAWSLVGYAADPLDKAPVVLLQPETVFQERVPSVQALASYIQAAESKASLSMQSSRHGKPTSGFVVIAVRPGQRSKVWLDFEPSIPPSVAEALITAIRSVQPPLVKNGPIVFALKVGLWGGAAPSDNMPSPTEWRAATEKAGHPLEIEALVEAIWRD
jgi:hypothetical protein